MSCFVGICTLVPEKKILKCRRNNVTIMPLKEMGVVLLFVTCLLPFYYYLPLDVAFHLSKSEYLITLGCLVEKWPSVLEEDENMTTTTDKGHILKKKICSLKLSTQLCYSTS